MRWWFLTLPEAALPDPDGAGNTVVNHYAPDIDHLSALLISALLISALLISALLISALLILLADAKRAAPGHRSSSHSVSSRGSRSICSITAVTASNSSLLQRAPIFCQGVSVALGGTSSKLRRLDR